jgi:hypothetical protein
MAHGAQRDNRAQPLVLKVKVPRCTGMETGEEFEQSPFVEGYSDVTRPLGRLIVDLARYMTLGRHRLGGSA